MKQGTKKGARISSPLTPPKAAEANPGTSPGLEATHYQVVEGFTIGAVHEAAEKFGVSAGDLARKIGLSRSTLHRKLAAKGRLTLHESDALARYMALLTHATDVFAGHQESARNWLTNPQVGLGGAVPLDFAQTTFGYQEVQNLLGCIDHGAYW